MSRGQLTDKQERFVREYVVDFNAAAAARRAGYSAKTATRQGPQLLVNPSVAARIKPLLEELNANATLRRQDVLDEVERLVTANPADAFEVEPATQHGPARLQLRPLTEWPRALQSRIGGFKVLKVTRTSHTAQDGTEVSTFAELVEIKLRNNDKALELAGRHLGLWTEEEGGGPDGKPILQINVGGMPWLTPEEQRRRGIPPGKVSIEVAPTRMAPTRKEA